MENVIEYDGWNNTSILCIDCLLMYMICVYIHCVVWEEIGDVLHGLGEDKGWTLLIQQICVSIKVLIQRIHVSIVKYGSVLCNIDTTNMCIYYGVWKYC